MQILPIGDVLHLDAIISLAITTTLLLGSPGPAPLALAATGATFGIRKGLPFLVGILVGLACVILGTSFGLATLFTTFPNLKVFCQILGACYIVFIAYKIATAPVNQQHNLIQTPNFKDGFILNLINPKAYAAFLAIFSQYLLPYSEITVSYLLTGIVCLVVATVVDSIWLCFGGLLKPMFSKPRSARILRILFALSMLIAVALSIY